MARSLTCGILIRVSSAQQLESLEKQRFLGSRMALDAAREMSNRKGDTYTAHIPDWAYYQDVMSGRKIDRPEYRRLINDLKERKLDVLIVRKVNRIARNIKLNIELQDALTEGRCLLMESGKSGSFYDFENPEDLRRFLSAGVEAQVQSQEQSQMAKMNHEFAKANQQAPNRLMRGFKRGDDKRIEIDPEQSDFCRLIIDTFLDYKTLSGTARHLTANGYSMSIPGVSRWLKHPVVRGHTRYESWVSLDADIPPDTDLVRHSKKWSEKQGKFLLYTIHLHTHPKLLTDKEEKQIDSLLVRNSGNKKQSGTGHPLSGKVFCARCGARCDLGTTPKSCKHKSDGYRYKMFNCYNYRRYPGVRGCGQYKIKGQKAKNNTVGVLFDAVENAVIDALCKRTKEMSDQFTGEKASIKSIELLKLEDQLRSLQAIPIDGNPAIATAISDTRRLISIEKAKSIDLAPEPETMALMRQYFAEPGSYKSMPLSLRRDVYQELVESVQLYTVSLPTDSKGLERIQVHLYL